MKLLAKTKGRATLTFLLGVVIVLVLIQVVNSLGIGKVFSLIGAPDTGLEPGQQFYLAGSIALCLTVFLFGAGPLSQHGRWSAPPGWIPTAPEPDDQADAAAPPGDQADVPKPVGDGAGG